MLTFIVKRLLQVIPLLLIIMTMTFFVMRLAPGNPFANERQLSEVVQRNLNRRFGLDRPIFYVSVQQSREVENPDGTKRWEKYFSPTWNGIDNQYHNYFFWRDVKDEETGGELLVRGPWVASAYYADDSQTEKFEDGWLRTGDVAELTDGAFIKLVDRTKDLVKSGGEWISSVELENAIMAHPKVAEAAVIGIPDEKWSERPLACVVLKPDASATQEELIEFISPQFAKWWLPDRVEFVSEIPKTSVGKFDKKVLRAQFRGDDD